MPSALGSATGVVVAGGKQRPSGCHRTVSVILKLPAASLPHSAGRRAAATPAGVQSTEVARGCATARRKRAVQQQNGWLPSSDRMRLLVVCDGARHEVVATSDMTARDIRTRVSTCDGVLTRGIGPSAVVLDEEVALSEQGVADRDRLILTTATSGTALGAALCALSTSAVKIDQLAAQLAAGIPAHEEFYTRVLVELDCTQAFDRCAQCARRLKADPSVTQSPAVADCPRPSGTNVGGGGRLWCSERRRGLRQRRQRLCVLVESHWPQARLRLHGARTAVRIGQRLSMP